MRWPHLLIGVPVFIGILLLTLILQGVNPLSDPPPSEAERWMAALRTGDAEQAVAVAQRMPLAPLPPLPNQRVVALSERYGVHRGLYPSPFNQADWLAWEHNWQVKELAFSLAGSSDDPVPALFAAVCKHLSNGDPPDAPAAWPMEVWRRGRGACDRQSWLLCALAYQLGCEGVLILLKDPETGVSPHTICELMTPDGRVYLADPYMEKLLPDTSLEALAGDAARLEALWPRRPDYRKALLHSRRVLPFHPQDFAPRNQALYRALYRDLREGAPRFGAEPLLRSERYSALLQSRYGIKGAEIHIWAYPFGVLRAALDRARADSARPR
jgi:hypothetical protein